MPANGYGGEDPGNLMVVTDGALNFPVLLLLIKDLETGKPAFKIMVPRTFQVDGDHKPKKSLLNPDALGGTHEDSTTICFSY
jgi:hypothetical protein